MQDNTALDIKVSNKVQEDDKKRKERDPRYQNEIRGGRHFPLNFLGGRPPVHWPVNAAPVRPGQANAPGPEVQIEQNVGGQPQPQPQPQPRPRQAVDHLHAAQRAPRRILDHFDNRKRNRLARIVERAPIARQAAPQGPQIAGYQGVIAQPADLRHLLAPIPDAARVAHQNALDARAHAGRGQHQHRPNNNPNNEDLRAILQPQGNILEQAQAEGVMGLQRLVAQRLFGNDHQSAAAAAEGRYPRHMHQRRDVLPGHADVLRDRGAYQEEMMGQDFFRFMDDPAFAPKPEIPGMGNSFGRPLMGPVAAVNRFQRGCHALLRNSEQPQQRPGRQYGAANSVVHQAAPQVGTGPASARGVQNNRA